MLISFQPNFLEFFKSSRNMSNICKICYVLSCYVNVFVLYVILKSVNILLIVISTFVALRRKRRKRDEIWPQSNCLLSGHFRQWSNYNTCCIRISNYRKNQWKDINIIERRIRNNHETTSYWDKTLLSMWTTGFMYCVSLILICDVLFYRTFVVFHFNFSL